MEGDAGWVGRWEGRQEGRHPVIHFSLPSPSLRSALRRPLYAAATAVAAHSGDKCPRRRSHFQELPLNLAPPPFFSFSTFYFSTFPPFSAVSSFLFSPCSVASVASTQPPTCRFLSPFLCLFISSSFHLFTFFSENYSRKIWF